MKLLQYCKYFFFLAWNWSPSLAWFVLGYEIRGERKYKLNTTGSDQLQHLKAIGVDISHASMYMPLNYFILEKLMAEIIKYPCNKTFLDIGCGKGRVMVVAAYYGFEKITGIDLSKVLCEDAVQTTRSCNAIFPATVFTVINNDAFYFEIPADITTLFLFNPFDEVITSGVVANVVKSQLEFPRTIRVVYANPLYKSQFIAEGFIEIYHIKKLEYLEGSILEKKIQDTHSQLK